MHAVISCDDHSPYHEIQPLIRATHFMKYEDLATGVRVIYVHTQREMTVTHLHAEDETATCAFSGADGNSTEARIPAKYLELMRDGGMMDNA